MKLGFVCRILDINYTLIIVASSLTTDIKESTEGRTINNGLLNLIIVFVTVAPANSLNSITNWWKLAVKHYSDI